MRNEQIDREIVDHLRDIVYLRQSEQVEPVAYDKALKRLQMMFPMEKRGDEYLRWLDCLQAIFAHTYLAALLLDPETRDQSFKQLYKAAQVHARDVTARIDLWKGQPRGD